MARKKETETKEELVKNQADLEELIQSAVCDWATDNDVEDATFTVRVCIENGWNRARVISGQIFD